jgi:hypothetical protein
MSQPSIFHAVKDTIVGAIKENVGYIIGNEDLETTGRQTKESGREEATNYYESSTTSTDETTPTIHTTTTPESAEVPPTPAQEGSDQKPQDVIYEQMHTMPTRESTNDMSEKAKIIENKPHEFFAREGEGKSPSPYGSTDTDREETPETKGFFDEFGAAMSGGQHEDSNFLGKSSEIITEPQEKKNESVEPSLAEKTIEKIRSYTDPDPSKESEKKEEEKKINDESSEKPYTERIKELFRIEDEAADRNKENVEESKKSGPMETLKERIGAVMSGGQEEDATLFTSETEPIREQKKQEASRTDDVPITESA